VATALGLEFAAGAMSAERVADALGGKQLMLVLDNCEHVIDAAARNGPGAFAYQCGDTRAGD
jgi:predicted ATPase